MKFTMSLIIAAMLWSVTVGACEICGCSGMGSYFGNQTNPWRYAIGLQHTYRQYHTTHPVLFPTDNAIISTENFHHVQLNAQIPLDSNWILFTEIPFVHLSQVEGSLNHINSGLGDIGIFIQYLVLRPKPLEEFSNRLILSGGLKFPTGNFQSNTNDVSIPNMQTGTGSYNFVANISYLRFGNAWGWGSEIGYTFNNTNSSGYAFGNRINVGIRGYRQFNLDIDKILQAQLITRYETSDLDIQNGYFVENSGGSFMLGGAGLGFITGPWNFNLEVSLPIWQNLSNNNVRQNLLTQVRCIYQL